MLRIPCCVDSSEIASNIEGTLLLHEKGEIRCLYGKMESIRFMRVMRD